ncbi:interleukin-like EMT inducer domain-containing protein [Burkholderia contaminans]|nr:interleukin-like EMT inducer domain-containing protein [Burkholderia contaminans]
MQSSELAQVINVRRIVNPLDPLYEIETEQWAFRPGATLADYLPLVLAEEVVVSRNGGIVESKDFGQVFPQPDDFIVLCPIPRGGGGFKGIFRMIAMVAVAIVAPELAGALVSLGGIGLAAAVGSAGLTAITAAVTVGIAVAGSLLVNAIMPPPTPTNSSNNSLSSSSTYGADGAKNTSAEGLPVPVCYGAFQMAGNIIGAYTENVDNSQILYMLINAGEGPIASISNIRLNDRDISEFKEVAVQTRMGDPTQGVIDWFSKVIVPHSKSQILPHDSSYLQFSTSDSVEQVRLDFTFPAGLFALDRNSGDMQSNTCVIEADYRLVGATDWTPFSATQPSYKNVKIRPKIYRGGFLGSDYPSDPSDKITDFAIVYSDTNTDVDSSLVAALKNQYWNYVGRPYSTWLSAFGGMWISTSISIPGRGGALIVTEKMRSTVRRSYFTPQLPLGKYEVRVRRNENYTDWSSGNPRVIRGQPITGDTSQSECYITDLNEIVYEGVAYNHTALVALRVQMDSQLSGIPSVTFTNGGRLITTMTRNKGVIQAAQSASANPAWVYYDMATNGRYGPGFSPDRLDMDSLFEWAEFCDANGLTFNAVLDQTMNFWDASAYVLRVGHAQVITVGTRYYIAIERASDPVMMFGMGNIMQDTFKQTWLGTVDRATEVDVTYFDRTDGYREKTVKVTNPDSVLEGQKQNASAITLYGVVDIKRAYMEGAFQLNLNRYLQLTCEWQSPVESIACAPGDVVLVQHDMPAWSESGRTAAGSSNSVIKLDKLVTMEAGGRYRLLVLSNTVTRGTSVIQAITGTFVQVANGTPSGRLMRLTTGSGADIGITNVLPDGVYVESTAGLSVGQAVTLIDTDVVEEHDVVLAPGQTDTVQLVSPMSYAPGPFINYMFGKTEKVKKPFRIKGVTLGSTDFHRTITAIEYRPEVYDLSQYEEVYGSLEVPSIDPSQGVISAVQNLTIYEETFVSGTQILTNVRAAWANPVVGAYAGADIHLSINGATPVLADTVRGDTSYLVKGLNKGDTVTVRAVAYDVWGKRASYDQSPTVTYKVVGSVSNLAVADVTGVNFIWAGKDLKLFWNYNSTTQSFEFGSEPNGADSGSLDPHFLDYEVRVYDHSHKLLRVEHTRDNNYIYTYEKNVADGTHRRVTVEIAVRDVFNNVGRPAVMDAYNPPPTVVSANQSADYDRVTISYTHSDDTDFAGAAIYLSDDPNFVADSTTLVYQGPDSSVLLPNLMFNHDYYYVLVPFDAFGMDETIPTPKFKFHTPFMDVNAIADGVLNGSKLIPELQQRIDLVDGNGLGSVNQRVQEAIDTANKAIAAASATSAAATKDALDAEAAARKVAEGALTAAITTEQQTRQAADDSLSSQVQSVTARVDQNAAAIQTEQTARANADSSLSTRIDTVVATTNANTAAITTEQKARTDADSALSTRIDTVTASVASANAAIVNEQTARANADSANASTISSVQAQLGNALLFRVSSNGASAVGAAATGLYNAVSGVKMQGGARSYNVATIDATGAVTTRGSFDVFGSTAARDNLVTLLNGLPNTVTVVVWTFDEPQANLSGPLQAALVRCGATNAVLSQVKYRSAYILVGVPGSNEGSGTEQYAGAVDNDTKAFLTYTFQVLNGKPVAAAGGQLPMVIQANVTSETNARVAADGALGSRIDAVVASAAGNTAAITSEQTARANADSALSTRIDTLSSTVGANTAAITSEQKTRSDADSALSSRIDTLATTVGSNTAAITTEQTARANGDSANAASITNLTTTVNGHTTTIQQQAGSINGLNAQYTVKIDNNGYVAGFGLASTTVNGVPTSEFAVRTDTFSVNLPGYAGVHPFTIGAVYGQPKVIISSALIGDASIDTAKIGDLQVNTAKIADGSINSAKIGFAAIQAAHIGEAQIDTLRIGQNAVTTGVYWETTSGSNYGSGFTYRSTGNPVLFIFAGLSTSAFGGVLSVDGKQLGAYIGGRTNQQNNVSMGLALPTYGCCSANLAPGDHSVSITGDIHYVIYAIEFKR